MAKRARPRVVWLPPTSANSLGNPPIVGNGYQIFAVDVTGATGDFSVGEIPLTIDSQDDPNDPNTSLADIASSGYRLRRIVGKVWCLQGQKSGSSGPCRLIITAGLIIRRSNPALGTSYASLDTTGDNQGPGLIQNYSDPWIWRRSWILSDNQTDTITSLPLTAFDNMDQASALDSAHVDQKTARIVSSEERLFLNVSSTILVPGDQGILASTLILTDLRILGSMMSSSGNRKNASR